MSEDKALIWNGSGFIPGIPARDLSAAEVEAYGGEKELLKTGLYAKPKPGKKDAQKEGK